MQTVVLRNRRTIAENTTELLFEIPPEQLDTFLFRAGQWVDLSLIDPPYKDDLGLTRTFSIASAPTTKGTFCIAYRDGGSAWKRSIAEMPLGTMLTRSNPGGQFTLPRATNEKLVFIADGMGVTPFLSMVRFATEQNLNYQIKLHTFNSSKERAPYLSELAALTEKNKNLVLTAHHGTRELDPIEKTPNTLWYIAGSPAFVTDIFKTLCERGIPENDILMEEFAGY